VNITSESKPTSEDDALSNMQGDRQSLDILFLRYRRTLVLVAYRVLGNHNEAEVAVQNCFRKVSDIAPVVEHQGAFGSWLVRVLIDEALMLLSERRGPI
jgi:RNA polymerase sigma-70 factor (ECF subfamily)